MPRGMRTFIVSPKEMKKFCSPPETWGVDKKGRLTPNVPPNMRFSLQRCKWRVVGLFAIEAMEEANRALIGMLEARNAQFQGKAGDMATWRGVYETSEVAYSKAMSQATWLKEQIEGG